MGAAVRKVPDFDFAPMMRMTDAARETKLSATTLLRWADAGLVRTQVDGRGKRWFVLEDIVRIRETPVKDTQEKGEYRATEEYRADHQERVRTSNEEALATASRHRVEWEPFEDEFLRSTTDDRYVDKEVAALLSRSLFAVTQRRLRIDASKRTSRLFEDRQDHLTPLDVMLLLAKEAS